MQDLAERKRFENQVLGVVARLQTLTRHEAFSTIDQIAEMFLSGVVAQEDKTYIERYAARHKMIIAIDKDCEFHLVTGLYKQVVQLGFYDLNSEVITHLEYAGYAERSGEATVASSILGEPHRRLLEVNQSNPSSFVKHHLRLIDLKGVATHPNP